MTKETPLAEKEWDVTISGYEGTKYHKGLLTKDVAEHVARLKEMSFSYLQSELLDEWNDNFDEIMGGFEK